MPVRNERRREILAADIDGTFEEARILERPGAHQRFPPCGTGIKTLVHGDDYLSSGSRASLDWLEKQLSEEYEIKTQRVCGIEGCAKDGHPKSNRPLDSARI